MEVLDWQAPFVKWFVGGLARRGGRRHGAGFGTVKGSVASGAEPGTALRNCEKIRAASDTD